MAATPPGTTVPVEVDRNCGTETFNVTVQERSGDRQARNTAPNPQQGEMLSGVAVTNLDSQTRTELRIPEGVQGALISDVDQSSPAYDAGLRAGDVITEINHQPVRNSEDAVNLTQKPATGQTLVKVWSHGGTRFVVVNEGSES